MKKEPTKKEIVQILLFGLGMVSFGVILIWIPVLGETLLFLGALLILIALLTVLTKVLK